MSNNNFMKLKNGMEIIFERITGVNVVSIFFVIKTGSSNEVSGKEGISHFLEHMIFKGTKKLSANEITEKIETLGGSINAYTSLDETVFYVSIRKKNWEKGFDILREMLFETVFDKKEFENEKKVIIEELRGGKDNPYKILIDETFSTVFETHPYKNPVIGYEESVNNLTLEDIREYYDKFYSPKNILLIITGDLHRENVKSKVESLDKIKNRGVIKLKKINEPAQKNSRKRIVISNIKQNYLNLAFRLPGGYFKNFAAIHVLSSLIGEFENSVLKEKLKEKLQLVTEINSFIHIGRNYSIFFINTIFPTNNSVEEIIKIIINEIENIKITVFPPDKIIKSIINHKSDKIFSKEYVSGAAKNILFYHFITGDYKNEERFMSDLEAVDNKSLQLCCSKYLNLNNANIILVASDEKKGNFNIKDLIVNKKNNRKFLKKREVFKLNNGIKVVAERNKRLPAVAFQIAGLGGLKFENNLNNGITKIMSKVWIEGSKNYSKKEIDEKFDFYSGFINGFSGRNSFGMQSLILKDYLREAFEIFNDILRNPLFESDKIDKSKQNLIEKIEALEDDSFNVAIRFFYSKLFGTNYYGMPIEGSIKTVNSIKRKDICSMYDRVVKSDNLVFGITGDLKISDMDFICSNLETMSRNVFDYNISQYEFKNKYGYFEKNIIKKQVHIIAGFTAPSIISEESVDLEVLKTIIGNHSGKLFVRLREELGLCYSVFAFYMNALEAGAFGIYVSTSPENKKLVIEQLKNVINELKDGNITNNEILKAKNYIKGSLDNFYQKYLNINSKNVYNILYGLGDDYDKNYLRLLNKVNKKSINDILEKYFNTDDFIYTVLVPAV